MVKFPFEDEVVIMFWVSTIGYVSLKVYNFLIIILKQFFL